jgi:alpha-tubulin suppressor-like RCC1 family protein
MASIKQISFFVAVTAAVLLTACARVSTPDSAPVPGQPALGSGVAHSCLLTQQGEVFCWGQGAHSSQDISVDTFGKPFQVDGLEAISLDAGWYHTCVTTRDGHVKCWGQNGNGQLGNGATEDSFSPVDVTGLEEVTSVAAGAAHSCALNTSGVVYCWGQNSQGQLGDGTTTDRSQPVQVTDLSAPAVSITAGPTFTCALLVSGKVECWGQLTFYPEDQNQEVRRLPVIIPGLDGTDMGKFAAGDNHLCILTKAREVKCDGIFLPPSDPYFGKPVENLGQIQGHVIDILAGTDFTCVLADTGKVYCWGDNYFDQLGDGTFVSSVEPKEVSRAGSSVVSLGGGHYTACALSSDGKVSCWGDTSFGQIGEGTARWK